MVAGVKKINKNLERDTNVFQELHFSFSRSGVLK